MKLETVIDGLARSRPIFHSEADFQHALAWCLHELNRSALVRLETPLLKTGTERLDLWIKRGPTETAIELKYLTRALDIELNGEHYRLRNQSAHDIRRYDVLKDIARVEAVIEARGASNGYVVVLTNDPNHWQPSESTGTADQAFRIHEGRVLTGALAWGASAGAGTTRGREQRIRLSGVYRCEGETTQRSRTQPADDSATSAFPWTTTLR